MIQGVVKFLCNSLLCSLPMQTSVTMPSRSGHRAYTNSHGRPKLLNQCLQSGLIFTLNICSKQYGNDV